MTNKIMSSTFPDNEYGKHRTARISDMRLAAIGLNRLLAHLKKGISCELAVLTN